MLPQTASKLPLFAALTLYFALTAALIARVPLGASPDEAAHWQYVEHIAQTARLPIFRGTPPPNPGYEFHQPPLYYLLCAPLWRLLGAGAQNYACRVVSMLCGLGTIALIWSAAQLLFPKTPRVAALAVLFAALLPLHQATGAGSNNDGLAGLLAAALFLLIARLSLNGVSRRAAWQFGIVAGLAILTKNTLLVLVFLGFVALIVAAKKPNATISLWPALGIATAVTLLIGGPWLARNQILYGDIFALGTFSRAAQASKQPGYVQFSPLLGFATYTRALLWMIFLTTWGFFGGPNSAVAITDPLSLGRIPGPRIPQLWLAPLVIMCVAAPLLAILGLRREKNEDESPVAPGVVTLWIVGVVLIVLAWAQFAFAHFAGAQARYLHPALLPFCIFLALGWSRLFRGKILPIASAILGATLLILTLLNLMLWKTLV